MQISNDYKLNVFNGYIGFVEDINARHVSVRFPDDNRIVEYTLGNAKSNLVLAYCSPIHKFQGSESPAGVVVLSTSHSYMLSRNLLYTAITRFKEKCVILGDRIALKRAVFNIKEKERYSRLVQRIEDFRDEATATCN